MSTATTRPSLAVLLAVAPLAVVLLIYGPDHEWGTISSTLSHTGSILPAIACLLGYAASCLVHLSTSGASFPLLLIPAYAATLLSTYSNTGDVENDCGVRCGLHAFFLALLILAETYLLLFYVRVTGWVVWPGLLCFLGVAVAYLVVIGGDEFDTSDRDTAYFLRAVGAVQLLSFGAARLLTAETIVDTHRSQIANDT